MEERTQGWERWLAGRDLGILVYLASQRRLSGGWMLNQEPPGRNPISEVVFSLANRNIPCHQTWSEFPCQVHALAMSCHHRWDTPTFLSKRNPGAWYNQELQHAPTGPPIQSSQRLGACCVPDFKCECDQRIWVQDLPALFSFCGFCLCSDPGAKEMLHCLRDLNLVA